MKGHWAERNVGVDGVRVVPARERGGARVFILAATAEGLRRALRARQERRRSSAVPGTNGRFGRSTSPTSARVQHRRVRRGVSGVHARSRGAIAGRQPGEAAAGHRADRLRRGRADGLGEVRVASRRRPRRGTTSDVSRAEPPRRAAHGLERGPPRAMRAVPRAPGRRPEGRPQLRLPRQRRHGQGRGVVAAPRPARRRGDDARGGAGRRRVRMRRDGQAPQRVRRPRAPEGEPPGGASGRRVLRHAPSPDASAGVLGPRGVGGHRFRGGPAVRAGGGERGRDERRVGVKDAARHRVRRGDDRTWRGAGPAGVPKVSSGAVG